MAVKSKVSERVYSIDCQEAVKEEIFDIVAFVSASEYFDALILLGKIFK